MSYVSPRSLQLLHDIISDSDQTSVDLYAEQTASCEVDNSHRVGNMNGDVETNFNDTLNLFEKLEKENGSVGPNGHVKVNGFMNGHVENGVQEDTLHGIAEESEDESYTVTEEVSETTADTSSSTVITKKNQYSRRSNRHRRDHNHNLSKPSKTSSVRDNSTDRDSMSDIRETMSDSGREGRRQRKLKRAQYREFRPIGLEPLETAEDRLEQKYKELEGLMSGQFVEQKKALTINHIQQMELLRQQYAIASHGLPPSGVLIPRSLPSHHRSNGYHRQTGRDKENHGHPASEDEAYTTIRTLQAGRGAQRRSRARSARTRPLSATRHNQSRSTSRDRRDKSDKNERNEGEGERSKARSRSNSGSRSSSRSPRRPATETHLKNTENEFVRDWIKKKDKELRQHKAEERRKKRQLRKEKIEKQLEREEKYKDSHQVVSTWMKQKQKEAYRKQREEQRELRQEVKEKEQDRSHSVSGIHGWGVDRPLSAPSPIRTDRNKIRVKRPGTTASEVQENEEKKAMQSENGDAVHQEIPQPPMTKYVYRRPVLGKVRLRTKSPQPEVPKPVPVRKSVEKTLSKEEIEKKQRVSYDEWLLQKRKDDQEKKKEMQRKKELAQSNPEYEVPVPELVQNSENNVLQGQHIAGSSGRRSARPEYVSKIISQEERERIREMAKEKKRLNRSFEEEVNSSYDERSESPDDAIQRVAKNVVNFVLKSLSDEEAGDDLFEDTDEVENEGLTNLSILGSRKMLSSKTRPMSASAAHIPGPQVSRSPRRPASAQPKQKEASQISFDGCIPFPDDIGAPPTVLRVQEKLFAERMSDNSEEGQQVTPGDESSNGVGNMQEDNKHTGAEANFHQRGYSFFEAQEEEVVEEEDQTKEEDGIRESQKKHVSFCEETTIFDDVDPDDFEELEAWNDAAAEADFDVEKIRKMFIEGCQDLAQEQEEQNQEQSNIEGEENQEHGDIEEQTQQQSEIEEPSQEQDASEEHARDEGDIEGQTQEQGDMEEQNEEQGDTKEQDQEHSNLEEQTPEDSSGNDQGINGENEEEIGEDLPQEENMDEEQEKGDQQQDGDSIFLTSSPEF